MTSGCTTTLHVNHMTADKFRISLLMNMNYDYDIDSGSKSKKRHTLMIEHMFMLLTVAIGKTKMFIFFTRKGHRRRRQTKT